MSESNKEEILALLNDAEYGSWHITELYHALLEYIKSGEAISDMGHPDFARGASVNTGEGFYSRYKPSTCSVFLLARAFSRYLNNYDMPYIWYRDLSTWQEFCKFVLERARIASFKRSFRKIIKSHNYYVQNIECPACGARRRDSFLDLEDEVSVELKDRLVHVDCRLCGKYHITFRSFRLLNSFEHKARLAVFLFTRADKTDDSDFTITPKLLKEELNIYLT